MITFEIHPSLKPGYVAPLVIVPERMKDCKELGTHLPDQTNMPCAQKLRKCAIHGTCTTGVPLKGVACCAPGYCDDHTEKFKVV